MKQIRRFPLALCLLACLTALPAAAKTRTAPAPAAPAQPGVNLGTSKSGTPVEVYADDGIELVQNERKVVAHRNARAVRGDVTVYADTLIAYYRNKAAGPGAAGKAAPPPPTPGKTDANPMDSQGGSSEIWRIEAIGHVIVKSSTDTAYGDHGDYNIDDDKVVLTGQNLRLITTSDVITARDSLEYWNQKQQGVARGNAKAVHLDKTVTADVLTADFAKNAQGAMEIEKAHADGHVVLTTPTETVTGNHSDYDVAKGMVYVTGNVQLTRDKNTLNGQYATVDLNSGISNLYPTLPGAKSGHQRVKGYFVPQHKNKDTKDPSAAGGKP